MATAQVEALPSDTRSVPGSFNVPLAQFPDATEPVSANEVTAVAAQFFEFFNAALDKGDCQLLSSLFSPTGFWRDHLALSWAFRTIQGQENIRDFLQSCSGSRDHLRLKRISPSSSTAVRATKAVPLDASGKTSGVQVFFELETAIGAGQGIAKLVKVEGAWRIFTLYTRLEELKGYEEPVGDRRPKGVEHGGKPGRTTWLQRRALETAYQNEDGPSVLIVGAGQSGLTIAARLKMLGVDALVIDQNDRIGDNWRKRYDQLVLHDPIWFDHMPYLNFPPQWPIFTPKDKLAQFFEAYAAIFELNVWTRTELVKSQWDDTTRTWAVTLARSSDGATETREFHPRHIVQATGHSGKKNQPSLNGIETFKGDVICHSSEFTGAKEGQKCRKAVVVGSCNSGHDIAQEYFEKGYDITMVQRSSTHVVSSSAITEIGLKGLYCEDGPPVDDADLLLFSQPTPVFKALQVSVTEKQLEHDTGIISGLQKAGFKVDGGPDNAGLFVKYFQRGGGYYIDVGASQLIIDGKIKVKQGQEIQEVLPHGLKFADGSELEADEIVLATGYQNMRTQTRAMFGDGVADRVGDVWGFNEEGEMRGIWQPSGHPGLWFHGGNLALCRYFSKSLALQIKGLEAGLYQYGDM